MKNVNEETEIPINMSEVFTALVRRDLVQAADMRDLEDRAKELTERTSSHVSTDEVEGGSPQM